VLQVLEGAEAGAVVVDRDFAAELGEPVGEARRRLQVLDPRGLGDLEGAAGRVGVAFVEPPLDVFEHRDVGQRGAGEVDVEGNRIARALALAEQVEGLADHPAVELLDHPGALGDADEGRGGEQLARVAAHPQQQLETFDRAVGEAVDRLRREAEAVLGECVADLRAGRKPARVAELRLDWRFEEGDAVAPLRLRPVHRLVGGGQHGLRPTLAFGTEHRDPDADRRPRQLRVAGETVGHLDAQVFTQLKRPLDVGLRHQHRELVAREAGDDVGGADAFAQGGGDAADQVVALLVAEAVVDLLQPVDVDHHHRAAAAVAGGEVDVGVEAGAKGAAVQQRGQRVVIGEVTELGLGLLGRLEGVEDHAAIGGCQFRQDLLKGGIPLAAAIHGVH